MTNIVQLLIAIVQILPIMPTIIDYLNRDECILDEHADDIEQIIELCEMLMQVFTKLKTAAEQCGPIEEAHRRVLDKENLALLDFHRDSSREN